MREENKGAANRLCAKFRFQRVKAAAENWGNDFRFTNGFQGDSLAGYVVPENGSSELNNPASDLQAKDCPGGMRFLPRQRSARYPGQILSARSRSGSYVIKRGRRP